jgi:TRAP-type C4-dicarboxylate transport system permease small subunit
MRRLNLWKLLSQSAAALVFLIIALTFFQVLLRYVFNSPVAWIEEISRYLFVWIVFLGSAVAFRSGTHIKVDIFEGLGGPASAWLATVRVIVTSGALGILVWSGLLVTWRNRSTASYTLPDFPAVLFYAAVPVASLLMLFGLWQWGLETYRGSKRED